MFDIFSVLIIKIFLIRRPFLLNKIIITSLPMDAYYKLIYISLMYLKPFDYCNCQNVTFLFSFKYGGRHLMLYVDDYGSMLNYMNAKQPCRGGGGLGGVAP